MADESEADDGALHTLFRTVPIERILLVLALLRYLANVRGPIPASVRARAQELADQPGWPLGEHPIVRRILEAP